MRALIDFALNNRLMVNCACGPPLVWGVVSFHNLPVEAYPDVATTNVKSSRNGRTSRGRGGATSHYPHRIQMAGNPHLTHLRSVSLFGYPA